MNSCIDLFNELKELVEVLESKELSKEAIRKRNRLSKELIPELNRLIESKEEDNGQ